MVNRIEPGRWIGVIGSGQLGRMLSMAASRLGLRTHVFATEENSPAGQVADRVTVARYGDRDAVLRFAESVDVATFEFENIPTNILDWVEDHCQVLPRRNALASSQDRLVEKDFITSLGLRTAPYRNVESAAQLEAALEALGVPSILKTRRFGYDGKGQVKLNNASDASTAFSGLGRASCILEGFVDFSLEISVIASRAGKGNVVCFDPGENVHREGILHTTTVPARISAAQRDEALRAARVILDALDYVGVMGIELFVTDGGLVVNEIAPRVHNSGHWTQNGCVIDQFEQHIRAVAGWPLGSGARNSDVVMTNLIGEDALLVEALSEDPAIGLHIYGKAEVKAGRKMGHYNRITGAAEK